MRLPRELKDIVGKTATIYQTNQEGALAFLIVLDKSYEGQKTMILLNLDFMPSNQKLIPL